MKNKDIRTEWEMFVTKYKQHFPDNPAIKPEFEKKEPPKTVKIKPKKSLDKPKPIIIKIKQPTTSPKSTPKVQPEISRLHKEYKTYNSKTLHEKFNKDDGKLWKEYHAIAETNERTFAEQELIPHKRIIEYLKNLKGKKTKVIADFGCGKAKVYLHFKDNKRFKFHNFDHYAYQDYITPKDISDTGLEDYSVDIVIMSLCLWGTNKEDYVKEAHRVLDNGGKLLMIETNGKRWAEGEKHAVKLYKLLETNSFHIDKKNEGKFVFIEAYKM